MSDETTQRYVDAIGYYRNLAIALGAKPEQMLNKWDRDLCVNGLNFDSSDYTVDDACGDLAEMWDDLDRLERWKDEALSVIDRWDDIADDLPATFRVLGARRSDCVAAYIDHLQAEVAELQKSVAGLQKSLRNAVGTA